MKVPYYSKKNMRYFFNAQFKNKRRFDIKKTMGLE